MPTEERPNYFLLLELDPAVEDWSVIEQRLNEKKRAWALQSSQGALANRRKAELYLGWIGKIGQVLKDPESRREEALAARRRLVQERQARFQELDPHLEVLRASGGYTDKDLAALEKQMKGTLSQAEIGERARAAGLARKDPAPSAQGQRPRLDPNIARDIRQQLDAIQRPHLYAFLEMSPRCSASSLRDRADELNRELLRIGKTDIESSAKKALCGHCMAVFHDEERKARYDNTLALQAMEALVPQIETAGGDGVIVPAELDLLVRMARERGVDPEDALRFVLEHAAQRKWTVVQAAGLSAAVLLQCGYCARVADSQETIHCAGCGEALAPPCPRCKAPTPTQSRACGQCGFVTSDAPLVRALLREGRELAAQGDLATALERYEQVLVYWPEWEEALKARCAIAAQRAAREAALGQVEALLRRRRLVEARAELARFVRGHGPAGTDALQQELRDGLARAEALLSEGQRLHQAGKQEEGLSRYEQALTVCADFTEARAALEANPPAPPTGLMVKPLRDGFHLDWTAIPGPASYRVVRKDRARPARPQDGVVVAEVLAAGCDDIQAEGGVPWYYAVYSVRGSVLSREAATSGPWLHTPEVSGLEVVAGDGKVTLRWRAARGCRVEVFRRAGNGPTGRGDGQMIAIAGDSAIDTGLQNGAPVGYLVVAVYTDPVQAGKERATPGVRAIAVPQAPPRPVTDLRCVRQGRQLRLSWSVPDGADQVQIRRAERRPAEPPGSLLSIEHLDRLGALVPAASAASAQLEIDGQATLWLVPVSLLGSVAVLGQAQDLTVVEDVQDLQARCNGSDITLTWTWPAGVEEVDVCHAPDRFPLAPSQGVRQRVTRKEYDQKRALILRGERRELHYFTVFACARGSGALSAGAQVLEAMGRETVVSYRVVVKRALLSRAVTGVEVELSASGEVDVPPLCVVARERAIPLGPADGVVVLGVAAQRLRGRAAIAIPREHWGAGRHIKLFFKDATDARRIRLLPAANDPLRLG